MRKTKEEHVPCYAEMVSRKHTAHIHTCAGNHTNADHFCPECKEWWGSKEK